MTTAHTDGRLRSPLIPWCVHGIGVLTLTILAGAAWLLAPFIGVLAAVSGLSYVLTATATAALVASLLDRVSSRINAHVKWWLFALMSLGWVIAWGATLLTFAAISWLSYLLSGAAVYGDNSRAFSVFVLLYTAPAMLVYLATSAILVTRSTSARYRAGGGAASGSR